MLSGSPNMLLPRCWVHPVVIVHHTLLVLAQAKNPSSDATLCPMDLHDPAAGVLRSSISAVLDRNLEGPAALMASFKELQQDLNAAGSSSSHLEAWTTDKHSLQETAAEAGRLLQVGITAQQHPSFTQHLQYPQSSRCQ